MEVAGAGQPFAPFLGHELRAVVRTDVFRDAVFDHRVGQYIDQAGAVDPAQHMNSKALACVFIDQVEHAHDPSIVGAGADEVIRPDVILMLRSQPHAGSIVEPQPPAWLLLLGNFPSSRRQILSTRSLPTFQPASRSLMVMRR